MDFVHGALFEGSMFRVLTIVDDHSRECPGLAVARSISGHRVARVLDRIAVYLPSSANSVPMTYQVRPDGRQHVVIAAGGHWDPPTRPGTT